MNLLLDTCTFLWLAEGDGRLSERCKASFQSPSSQVFLSAASGWEISLKVTLKKLALRLTPQEYIPRMRELHQIESLAISEEDAVQAGRLPLLHRDPFDRLLVAQALGQGLVLVTPDALIAQYPVRTLW